ncbi:MAG: hypothetical protein Q4D79_07780 [Propionibacteriaceae bacterium]|nr:hypothetical protein [Propionibacteriaceae bacterium]
MAHESSASGYVSGQSVEDFGGRHVIAPGVGDCNDDPMKRAGVASV